MIYTGKFISIMGIPSSGKSSFATALADEYGEAAKTFLEPTEDDAKFPWPKAVYNRNIYGYFGSVTWFRAMRVPLIYDAFSYAKSGGIGIIDTYYDKLLYGYLGKKGLDWFYPANDQYFDVLRRLAEMDYYVLPEADIVIFLKVTYESWVSFYKNRNRNMDQEKEFREQCFALQNNMIMACDKYKKDFCKEVIYIEQDGSPPSQLAKRVMKHLKEL